MLTILLVSVLLSLGIPMLRTLLLPLEKFLRQFGEAGIDELADEETKKCQRRWIINVRNAYALPFLVIFPPAEPFPQK